MIKQISLSQHIKYQLNEDVIDKDMINEGLFDKMKSFWSGTASIWGNLTSAVGGGESGGKNKVLDALKSQMKELKDEEKKKMKDFQDAKENKLVEKVKAKYALKKKQMSLKWDKKIKEQNSLKDRYKSEASFFGKSNRIYSDSEMKAIEARLDADFTEIDPDAAPTGAAKIRENMSLLLRKEDGTLRSEQELKKFIKGKGASIWKDFNVTMEENQGDIMKALESGGYKDYIKEVAADAIDRQAIDRDMSEQEERKTLCENTESALAKYSEMREKYKKAKEDVGKFGDEEITDSNAADLLKNCFSETDTPEDVTAKLKSMGLSEEQINQVTGARATASAIKDELDLSSLTDDERSAIITAMKTAKQSAESKLAEYPNPNDEESNAYQTLSEEDKRAIETAKNAIRAAQADENGEVNDDDIDFDNYPAESIQSLQEEAKAEKEAASKKINELQQKKDDYDSEEAAKQQHAKEVHETVKQRGELGELKNTDEYKAAAKEIDPDLNPGEIKKEVDGKKVRGFEDADGNFHQIPDVSDEEGYKKYEEERKMALAAKPLKGTPVLKKQEDGTYTATYPDGTEETGLSKADAAKKLIEAETARKERTEIEEGKKMVADKLKKMTAKEFNELKEKADNGDKSAKALMKVYDSAVNDEDFFKDAGSISQSLVDSAKKNIEGSEIDFDYRKEGREDEQDADNDEDIDDGNGGKKKLKDLDDTDVKDEKGNPLKNPAKEYHKKTYKRGDKTFTTKSYYDSDGKNPISPKEYNERVEKFKTAYKKKNESSLSTYITNLVENKNKIKSIKLSITF